MERPQLDESKASEYIGKTVLLGVTYLDHNERFQAQQQWVGTIAAFSNAQGIRIKLRDSEEPSALPPVRAASARRIREFTSCDRRAKKS
jgi:hypothetical protein